MTKAIVANDGRVLIDRPVWIGTISPRLAQMTLRIKALIDRVPERIDVFRGLAITVIPHVAGGIGRAVGRIGDIAVLIGACGAIAISRRGDNIAEDVVRKSAERGQKYFAAALHYRQTMRALPDFDCSGELTLCVAADAGEVDRVVRCVLDREPVLVGAHRDVVVAGAEPARAHLGGGLGQVRNGGAGLAVFERDAVGCGGQVRDRQLAVGGCGRLVIDADPCAVDELLHLHPGDAGEVTGRTVGVVHAANGSRLVPPDGGAAHAVGGAQGARLRTGEAVAGVVDDHLYVATAPAFERLPAQIDAVIDRLVVRDRGIPTAGHPLVAHRGGEGLAQEWRLDGADHTAAIGAGQTLDGELACALRVSIGLPGATIGDAVVITAGCEIARIDHITGAGAAHRERLPRAVPYGAVLEGHLRTGDRRAIPADLGAEGAFGIAIEHRHPLPVDRLLHLHPGDAGEVTGRTVGVVHAANGSRLVPRDGGAAHDGGGAQGARLRTGEAVAGVVDDHLHVATAPAFERLPAQIDAVIDRLVVRDRGIPTAGHPLVAHRGGKRHLDARTLLLQHRLAGDTGPAHLEACAGCRRRAHGRVAIDAARQIAHVHGVQAAGQRDGAARTYPGDIDRREALGRSTQQQPFRTRGAQVGILDRHPRSVDELLHLNPGDAGEVTGRAVGVVHVANGSRLVPRDGGAAHAVGGAQGARLRTGEAVAGVVDDHLYVATAPAFERLPAQIDAVIDRLVVRDRGIPTAGHPLVAHRGGEGLAQEWRLDGADHTAAIGAGQTLDGELACALRVSIGLPGATIGDAVVITAGCEIARIDHITGAGAAHRERLPRAVPYGAVLEGHLRTGDRRAIPADLGAEGAFGIAIEHRHPLPVDRLLHLHPGDAGEVTGRTVGVVHAANGSRLVPRDGGAAHAVGGAQGARLRTGEAVAGVVDDHLHVATAPAFERLPAQIDAVIDRLVVRDRGIPTAGHPLVAHRRRKAVR